MIITCPQCTTRYEADAGKFPPAGRNVRCARCGHVWHQMPEAGAESEALPDPGQGGATSEPPLDETEASRASAFVRQRDGFEDEAPPRAAPDHGAAPSVAAARPWYQHAAVSGGWAALVLIVLTIGWSAVRYRQDVTTAWPRSASLYSALGLNVNIRGIAFTGVTYKRGMEDGAPVLTVTGQLVNVSSRALPVPQVRIALTDKDRRELFSWTYVPSVLTLKPGQVEPFRTRLASPPDGARHLELRFVKAGE